jgi:flagellar FliL protein
MTELSGEYEQPREEPPRRPRWLDNQAVMLGVIVVTQILLAIALARFAIAPHLATTAAGVGQTSAAAPGAERGVIVGLDEIIVTLQSDARLPRYLRIEVNLEVADEQTAKLVAERRPQLRDSVIIAASARTVAEIQSPQGKQELRRELREQLAAMLPPDRLRHIYFSDLVVQ